MEALMHNGLLWLSTRTKKIFLKEIMISLLGLPHEQKKHLRPKKFLFSKNISIKHLITITKIKRINFKMTIISANYLTLNDRIMKQESCKHE